MPACGVCLLLTVFALLRAYRRDQRAEVVKTSCSALCFALVLLSLLPALQDGRRWGHTSSVLLLLGALALWAPEAVAWLAHRRR